MEDKREQCLMFKISNREAIFFQLYMNLTNGKFARIEGRECWMSTMSLSITLCKHEFSQSYADFSMQSTASTCSLILVVSSITASDLSFHVNFTASPSPQPFMYLISNYRTSNKPHLLSRTTFLG